jgi:hypothetical protein
VTSCATSPREVKHTCFQMTIPVDQKQFIHSWSPASSKCYIKKADTPTRLCPIPAVESVDTNVLVDTFITYFDTELRMTSCHSMLLVNTDRIILKHISEEQGVARSILQLIRETVQQVVNWIQLAPNTDQWQSIVIKALNRRVP